MIFEKIKKLCDERGIAVYMLEEELGLGRGTIYKWKENNPRSDNLQAVATFLGVTVDELLKNEKEYEKGTEIEIPHRNY